MDTDEEQFSNSDSEPTTPMAEKRQYHNQLERERRNVLKSSFEMLRCAVPSLVENPGGQTPRAKTLKKSIAFIKRSGPKRQAREMAIKELKHDNRILKEQIQALEALEKSTDLQALQECAIMVNGSTFKQYELETMDSDYDDEDSDEGAGDSDNDSDEAYSEEECNPTSKRAKTNWSPEVWDDDEDVEENPEPQQNWSVSVPEAETESETSDSSDSYGTE